MEQNSDLVARLRQTLSQSPDALLKKAGIEENAPEVGGAMDAASSPEAAQEGSVATVVAGKISEDGQEQPGTSSNVTEGSTSAPEAGGVEASATADGEANQPGDAAKALGAVEGEITKDDLDMIDKAACALQEIACSWKQVPMEAFQKQASAEDPQALMQKLADAGDIAAQSFLNYQASFLAGINKKASDLEEMGVDPSDPEAVAAAEEALNAGALEDPESVLMDEGECCGAEGCDEGGCGGEGCDKPGCGEGEVDVEDIAAVLPPELQAVAAEVEAAAQEATAEVAAAIQEKNPEISGEDALQAAQQAVTDSLEVIATQQGLGATDENGEYAIPDDVAEGAVEDMLKSASANPLRDHLCSHFNNLFKLSPEAFATRISR